MGERRMMFAEHRTVRVRIHPRRLHPGRPNRPCGGIAGKDERPKCRLRLLCPPAGNRHISPPAKPLARGRQHDAVVAIRQKMRRRRPIHRGLKHTNGWHIAGFHPANQNFPGARRCGCNVARHAFLQQQFSPLDHGFAVKTVTQAAILQRVGNGRNCHALMMRHKAAHDGVVVVFLQPCGGKIDRFIKPVTPFGTQCCQLRIVLLGRHRINHRCQTSRIRRNHLVLA